MCSAIQGKIVAIRIDSTDDAWEFAKYLVDIIGLSFYHEEIYKITSDLGMRVKRIPFFKDNERYNILLDLGLLEQPYKQVLKEKIIRAIWICDEFAPCSFADMLCNYTESESINN